MTHSTARERAEEFLRISDQFRLGELVTESPHPVTAYLSEVARESIPAALDLLFRVDGDVVEKYREWAESRRSEQISRVVADSLLAGGRVFFTGCGATGRLSILLDSIWRGFWQGVGEKSRKDWENRTVSIMAGGDFALIKSVEGFEDITAFGRRQIAEHGVKAGDVVFAITEGGETSWVIGTAWEALDRGAKVYFVYNNPDDVLRDRVERSREVIDDPRIEKINLTTGPMAITGSTRMQATSIQLCVMLTVMEMVVQELLQWKTDGTDVPRAFLANMEELLATLRSEPVLRQLAALVELEESVYRQGGKTNYFAESLALDVLTDTTERSPTFCTPPFRRYDDGAASESWVYLFTRQHVTEDAWCEMLKRDPSAVEWTRDQVRELVSEPDAERRHDTIRKTSLQDILKFKIGLDGLDYRRLGPGDAAIEIATDEDHGFDDQRGTARAAGARAGLICLARPYLVDKLSAHLPEREAEQVVALVTLPGEHLPMKSMAHIAAKMLLNALSTCVMVRLGRVMGNYMIYVVPSNLKLIDRATRYISQLADLPYEDACRLLFEVIEYVEPRMKSDQSYPPVVGMAVTRAKHGIGNAEAEARLADAGRV